MVEIKTVFTYFKTDKLPKKLMLANMCAIFDGVTLCEKYLNAIEYDKNSWQLKRNYICYCKTELTYTDLLEELEKIEIH